MNYRIVQVQPDRPEGGSVCKVILQSSEWFMDTLTHQRHDTQGSISGMAAERGRKKVFTLTGSEEVHSQKALCVLTFIRKGWVSLRGSQ